MTCSKCNAPVCEGDRFCRFCGNSLIEKPGRKTGSLLVPALVLAVMSVLGFMMYFIQPFSPPVNETPWFTLEDGILSFDPSLYEGSDELTVPSTVNGQPVLELSQGCFTRISGITAIHLPDGLQIIGDRAFAGCDTLRAVSIPEGVTRIGDNAFTHCTSLEAVTIPGSVSSIGSDAFTGCEKLQHIFYNEIGRAHV